MKLHTVPEDAVVMLVGIDHYAYGDKWKLPGPAEDALRYADWFLDRGVLRKNIAIFLSQQSWNKNTNVRKWETSRSWSSKRFATRESILRYVDSELPHQTGKCLIIAWGGHGAISDWKSESLLFTEDALPACPYCVSLADLVEALRGVRFAKFREQVFLIDACSTEYSSIRESTGPGIGRFVRDQNTARLAAQVQMLASSPGGLATNLNSANTGLFTSILQGHLFQYHGIGWPDLLKAFDLTIEEVIKKSPHNQRPYLLRDWPGHEQYQNRNETLPQRPSDGLFDKLDALRVADGVLQRMFYLSLPDTRIGASGTNLSRMVSILVDCRPKGPSRVRPIVEFAARLAAETGDPGLRLWVEVESPLQSVERTALDAQLASERGPTGVSATVFIEVSLAGEYFRCQVACDIPSFSGQIGNPRPIEGDCRKLTNILPQLAKWLGEVMTVVESRLGWKVLKHISFIVPHELLPAELDSLEILLQTPSLPDALTTLREKYSTSLHWNHRALATDADASPAINSWRNTVHALQARFHSGTAASILWAADSARDSRRESISYASQKLLHCNSSDVCVGIPHATSSTSEQQHSDIMDCLRQGVPCFVWLSKNPANLAAARRRISHYFRKVPAATAPRHFWNLLRSDTNEAHLAVQLVWDEPTGLPDQTHFQHPMKA